MLSINVSTGGRANFIDSILRLGKSHTSSYVCFANVHMLVEAQLSPEFKLVINNADIVAPDGKPIVKCLDLFYSIRQEKIDGMAFLPQLLEEFSENKLSVFFFGGTEDLLQKTSCFLQENYKALKVAGMIAPPFRPLSEIEKDHIAVKIQASGANVVIVVLGCPKQERWMAEMKGKIPAVMLGMGAAVPVLIGEKRRAPAWMQKAYLECFYRMYQEPSRLIKRYTVTNSIFLVLLFKKLIHLKVLKTISRIHNNSQSTPA